MEEIFVNQTKLLINFNVNVDITGATAVLNIKSPTKVLMPTAPLIVSNAILGKLQFVSNTTSVFIAVGEYTLWPVVTWPDGKTAAGKSVKLNVLAQGT